MRCLRGVSYLHEMEKANRGVFLGERVTSLVQWDFDKLFSPTRCKKVVKIDGSLVG